MIVDMDAVFSIIGKNNKIELALEELNLAIKNNGELEQAYGIRGIVYGKLGQFGR